MTEENKQLLEVLRHSLWDDGKNGGEIPDLIRAELCDQTVEGLTAIAYSDTQNLKYVQTARFVKMAHMQRDAIQQLQDAEIPVAVIKGTAAGIYYPHPQLRTYGDIDLMVQPERYHEAVEVLRGGGWRQSGVIGSFHTAFNKNNERLELHQCRFEQKKDKETQYIFQFLLSGFSDIQEGVIEQGQFRFPMFPWKQNGLELIWHFRVHLYNGIGLRHVIDWMMFVNVCLDDDAFWEYKSVLEQAGLLPMAKTITRLCQLYLGLKQEDITWCADADDALCAELLTYIFEQGNFGTKKTDDKAAKVLTRYRGPIVFLRGMQRKGLDEWYTVEKHPFLKCFAWLHLGIQEAKSYLSPAGRKKLWEAHVVSGQRKKLFDQLFGNKSE